MAEPSFLEGPLRTEDVRAACRWIIGRDPKSEAEVEQLLAAHPTRAALRRHLLASKASLHEHLKSRFGPEKWVLAEVLDGKRIWLNLIDRHVSLGCLLGSWEPDETAFLRRTLRPGQVVADVGANIGWFSLVAAECVGPGGYVHAFEPQPRVFAYLARTIAENGLLGPILPYQMALSDRWGTVEMRWNPGAANMGRAWISDGAQPEDSLGKVPAGVLDDLLAASPLDFLKIDAEGAEGLILAGADALLKRCRPIVLLEMVPALLARVSATTPDALFARFAERGYQGFAIAEGGQLGERLSAWPAGSVELNLVFLPS